MYSLCRLVLNGGLGGLRKMVLLLVSLIEMGWGRLLAGQIMNWVGDGDGSCVKATEERQFLS